jgi:voltage-gated potassium channel Kch
MAAITLRQRLRYGFDNTMARGTGALIGWLALATLGLVIFFTLLIAVASLEPDDHHVSFVEQMFLTLFHALDPGAIGGDEFRWKYILPMLAVTVGGIFVVSALIGVIATAFEERLDELRKGRSLVLENGHTLILGWSEAVFTILSELRIANSSEKKPSVVILADRDKVEMDDAIHAKLGHMGNTRVVCRSGSPIDLTDLEIVSPHAARAIIVLSGADDEPDAEVVKTILALTHNPHRRPEPYHIVAEIEDARNIEIAKLVGGNETVVVNKGDTIARLIVQASRQSGVSVVYTELFDYGGDEIYSEIYLRPAEVYVTRAVGFATLVEAARRRGETAIGYRSKAVEDDAERNFGIVVNPAKSTIFAIEPGDRLIVLAEN